MKEVAVVRAVARAVTVRAVAASLVVTARAVTLVVINTRFMVHGSWFIHLLH
jgi:hypothetical protein